MDVADISRAPPEYLEVRWMADLCKLIMGVGWTTNYIGMIYKSLQQQTYSMALIPLCCNFAWELTYAILFSFGSHTEKWIHYIGLLINCGVMYTAVQNAPREFSNAPLVQKNLNLIFFVAVLGFASGHAALAVQIGPSMGMIGSAYICQLILCTGGLCQLISRGSTRGTSFLLWSSRFIGSLILIPQDYLRYKYWPEEHQFLASPLYLWFITIFILLDGSYGLCLWYVRSYERQKVEAKKL